MSDFFRNVGQYWADDNAEFERSNPTGLQRAWRGVNPMTGLGSALGDMHTAAGQGDLGGMAMAGVQAIPGVGALKPVMPWVKGIAARNRNVGGEVGKAPLIPGNERVPQGPLPGMSPRQPSPTMNRDAEIAQGIALGLQRPFAPARWREVLDSRQAQGDGQGQMPQAPALSPEQEMILRQQEQARSRGY